MLLIRKGNTTLQDHLVSILIFVAQAFFLLFSLTLCLNWYCILCFGHTRVSVLCILTHASNYQVIYMMCLCSDCVYTVVSHIDSVWKSKVLWPGQESTGSDSMIKPVQNQQQSDSEYFVFAWFNNFRLCLVHVDNWPAPID
jgi:hypothetical protein